MGRRVFIGIKLPENTRKKLSSFEGDFNYIPAKWTKEYNLHITLIFLGYVRDENLKEICNKVEDVCFDISPFEIKINRIEFGPLGKSPKMIWAVGEKNKDIAYLNQKLEDSLFINQNMDKYFKKEQLKSFTPHITLARIKQSDFKKMEESPEISQDLNINFFVQSIDIIESELKKGGPEYTVLKTVFLNGD